jgi:hypothetical protein
VADWFAASDSDGSTKALGVFTQAGGEWLNPRSFHGQEVLLNHGCPDCPNVGIPAQDRDEVGLTVPAVFRLTDKSVQPQPNLRGGVLHALGVFQHPEALVGILHDDFPVGIRGDWKSGKLLWEWLDYFSIAISPVE